MFNYVIYYHNSAGYPRFAWACANSMDDAIKDFMCFHPNLEIKEVYISVKDLKSFLILNL